MIIFYILFLVSVIIAFTLSNAIYFSLKKFPEDFHIYLLLIFLSFLPFINLYIIFFMSETLIKYWKYNKENKSEIEVRRKEDIYKELDKYKLKDIESYLRMKKLKNLKIK